MTFFITRWWKFYRTSVVSTVPYLAFILFKIEHPFISYSH
jgi:hypothetical protein